MTTIAILGFFILILLFFYLGRDDFGLKPTPKKNLIEKVDETNNKELEEIKS
tara:strand:- start:17949 stop:18104 length:156 start_codon:yes stop_codon:yes gene_type:complete